MVEEYILSIDIGTSSCKVVLFDQNGTLKGAVSREHQTFFDNSGGVWQEPAEWWDGVCRCTKQLLEKIRIDFHKITVIGIDSQSSSMIPVSKEGTVLFPAMIWTDHRAGLEKDWIDQEVGQQIIDEINGNRNDASNVGVKLLWLKNHHPAIYQQTYKILNAAGYLVYCLTGKFTTNISEGGLTQLFDIQKGTWSNELIHTYGLNSEKLPEILPCYAIAGVLTQKASEELGLQQGTRVVAGSMDAVACGLGCGAIEEGDSYITGGTVTALGICSNRPVRNHKLHVYHHIVPGRWCNVAGVDYGGGSFRWYRDTFMEDEESEHAYDKMNLLASQTGPGSDRLFFLPSLVGQRCPQWDETMRGVYFGISPNHTQANFIRALMEGTAYAVREILEIQENYGVICNRIRVAGGIMKSELWLQIFSDILGIPLYKAKYEEATAIGNMLNAAFGVGMIPSFEAGMKQIEFEKIEFNQNNYRKYEKLYSVYKELYPALTDLFHKNAELSIE